MTELSVSVEGREAGSLAVVRLAGEADLTTQALTEVLNAESAKKPRLLLVDVSGLTFIDSAALHELVRTHRKLQADGCQLALIGPTRAVARVIQLSGLDQVFLIYASLDEAGIPAKPPLP